MAKIYCIGNLTIKFHATAILYNDKYTKHIIIEKRVYTI